MDWCHAPESRQWMTMGDQFERQAAFCPLTLTTAVLGDRWVPLILREMLIGNTRFNEIARCLPGISRSLLVQRLRHLERKGVIETRPSLGGRGKTYHLTPAGKDLHDLMIAMGRWSITWMYDALDPAAADAEALMWWMHRRVDPSTAPHDRVVVQFEHTAPARRAYWMVFERNAASVCVADPGFDVDAVVTCPTEQLARVFNGYTTWAETVRTGADRRDRPPRRRARPADVVPVEPVGARRTRARPRAALTPAGAGALVRGR